MFGRRKHQGVMLEKLDLYFLDAICLLLPIFQQPAQLIVLSSTVVTMLSKNNKTLSDSLEKSFTFRNCHWTLLPFHF